MRLVTCVASAGDLCRTEGYTRTACYCARPTTWDAAQVRHTMQHRAVLRTILVLRRDEWQRYRIREWLATSWRVLQWS